MNDDKIHNLNNN